MVCIVPTHNMQFETFYIKNCFINYTLFDYGKQFMEYVYTRARRRRRFKKKKKKQNCTIKGNETKQRRISLPFSMSTTKHSQIAYTMNRFCSFFSFFILKLSILY